MRSSQNETISATGSDGFCVPVVVLNKGVGFVFLLLSSTKGWSLPPCPEDQSQRYHNCFGTFTYSPGNKYVGEWRDNYPNGQGTFTLPKVGTNRLVFECFGAASHPTSISCHNLSLEKNCRREKPATGCGRRTRRPMTKR